MQTNVITKQELTVIGMDDHYRDRKTIIASCAKGLLELLPDMSTNSTVRLHLEDLKCFEVVERQYQNYGVIFRNAIALQPSNPAFPAHSGNTLLLASPKAGFLEILFLQPVRFFSAYITSSQRTILTAYDQQDKPIAHTEMSVPNLAGSDSSIPPNHQLSLTVPNIYRVTFYAFDGQLTVDDICFGV
jgi:hypothetical protein